MRIIVTIVGLPQQPPLFVASDIDGTLLDSRDRVSPKLRQAVAAMADNGTTFTLATGRPARWILPVLEQLPVKPTCVCANGAVTFDSSTGAIIATRTLPPEVLDRVISDVGSAYPDLGFAVERAGAGAFDADGNLFAVGEAFGHVWAEEAHILEPREQLVSLPATKLLIRSHTMNSSELFKLVSPLIDRSLASATYSWEGGLVEVAAPNVSKRSALEQLAQDKGIGPERVLAFGDMPNDIEMLTWAGCGVAMGNAHDKVKAAADVVTFTNDDDGVARVLAHWFI